MVGLHVARDLFLCQTNMWQEQLILSSAEDMYVIPICFTSYFRIICFFFLLSDDFRSNIVFYLLFAYSSKMAVYIGHFEVFNIQWHFVTITWTVELRTGFWRLIQAARI